MSQIKRVEFRHENSLNKPRQHFVSKLQINDLWGDRNFSIRFNADINIIIGGNASGKTTIINILHHAITANIFALAQMEFSNIAISFQSFDSESSQTLEIHQFTDTITISINGLQASMPLNMLRGGVDYTDSIYFKHTVRRKIQTDMQQIRSYLATLIPAVWLPVSRRLPINDEEDSERRRLHKKPLESVDECLAELLEGLKQYRIYLDVQLSDLRKDFQKHALETILYDKQHDQPPQLSSFSPPTVEDKLQLIQAFADVGFSDSKIRKRIEEHFKAAEKAAIKLKESHNSGIDLSTLFIFPLINRTTSMVSFARELEGKRHLLFSSLLSYELIVSDFLSDKHIQVTAQGVLKIFKTNRQEELPWRNLSSGEKQILILLTQALLSERSPIVYVADEPELSLHVTWQEKLVSSIMRLAGRCQLIIATHSPDIAGGYSSRIIKLKK